VLYQEVAVKKIGILTSGGNAPGMNAFMNFSIGKLRGLVSEILTVHI